MASKVVKKGGKYFLVVGDKILQEVSEEDLVRRGLIRLPDSSTPRAANQNPPSLSSQPTSTYEKPVPKVNYEHINDPSKPPAQPSSTDVRSKQGRADGVSDLSSSPPSAYDGRNADPELVDHVNEAQISRVLKDFLVIQAGAYSLVEKFCSKYRGIWEEDWKLLPSIAIKCLQQGDLETAMRVADRYYLFYTCSEKRFRPDKSHGFLRELAADRAKGTHFLEMVKKYVGQLNASAQTPKAEQNTVSQSKGTRHAPNRSNNHGGIESTLSSMKSLDLKPREAPLLRSPQPPTSQDPLGLGRRMHYQNPNDVNLRGSPPEPTAPSSYENVGSRLSSYINAPISRVEPVPNLRDASSVYGVPEIDNKTKGPGVEAEIRVGPNVGPTDRYLSELSEDEVDTLHKSYYVRSGQKAREFFVLGRVLSMIWHENAGRNKDRVNMDADRPFHCTTKNRDGMYIFSSVRRYVIVKAKPDSYYCWAVPINTYGKYGLSRKNFPEEERKAHAIIHSLGTQPIRIQGEKAFTKGPIVVDPGNTHDILHKASRVHFGKVQSIEWNVRVRDCGRVTPDTLRRLMFYFKREYLGDAIEEEEGEGDEQ